MFRSLTRAFRPYCRTKQATSTAQNSSSPLLIMRRQANFNAVRPGAYMPQPVELEDMPYVHHGKRPRYTGYKKFKSPRKKASKLFHELKKEEIEKSKASNPDVWKTKFKVGDAIEVEHYSEDGVTSKKTDKIRGMVIGIYRKGLDHSVLLRDVLYGEPVEFRIPLHSPLTKSIKVLHENFLHKGRKRVKRAKLYYLRKRNPLDYQVTKKK